MGNPEHLQHIKAKRFSELHASREFFVIPNPWSAGSAKILTSLGFKALASTGAGFAFSKGLADHQISREQLMLHLAELCAATHLPISADLEGGFGVSPTMVHETIQLAAKCGVVGGSIEDSTDDESHPLFDLSLSVERIEAAVSAKRDLDFPFVLTARAENYFIGKPDLGDVIKRLQAYEEAGADVLFAPGLKTKEDIATLLKEVSRPVNVLAGVSGMQLSIRELKDLGVSRISVGGSLARSAIAALYRSANELVAEGAISYSNEATSAKFINELFSTF